MDDRTIKESYVVADTVAIADGKIKFVEMRNSDVISNKYREKVSFVNFGNTFMIKGNLDLAGSHAPVTTISGNSTKNEKSMYVGEGLWAIDNKKNQKEFIKILLKSLN